MRDNTILLAAAPVEWVQAELGVDAGDKRLKQFSGTAYTGGAMKANYRQPVVIDLAGLTAASESIPFLYQHDPSQIVGHGVAAIGPDSIRVSGQVSGVGQAASEVTALAANGFRWQMSVGVSPSRIEQVDAGATATANGRQFTGPAVIVRAGELREVSFVAIGADGRTAASVAASYRGDPMTYEQWLQARGWDAAQLTADQSATLRAAYDAEQAPPAAPPAKQIQAAAPPVDLSAIVASAVSQAMAAARDQQEAAAVLASFESRVEPQALATIRASAIAQSWNRDRVELECRRAARPEAPAIHVTASAINPEALEVGILRASSNVGSAYLERTYRPEVLAAADAPAYRRMTLHKLLGTVASAGGVYAHPGDKESLVEAAFRAQQKLLTFDAFSTVNLSGILSNTANKAMLASYLAVGATWNRIAAVRSHSDFKVNTLYRMDADGAFKKVGSSGELKLSTFSETTFTKQLSTFGTIISLTRRDMVNDDLGAFLQIAQQLGRMAAIRIEEAVYVLLLGSINSTLFTSGNGNYLTGAGALSLTSLAALAAKFNDQVDSQGKPVLIQPRVLLVGSAIKTTAENLYNETVVVGSTTTDKLQPARNPHAGLYEPVSSPYVNNTRIRDQDGVALSGQTATGFGLFADPAERAALGVAFLNGAQSPTIQSGEVDFAQLGMQFRGYIDFGVGLEDPTAAAWSTGT
jgi:hypothetical protein